MSQQKWHDKDPSLLNGRRPKSLLTYTGNGESSNHLYGFIIWLKSAKFYEFEILRNFQSDEQFTFALSLTFREYVGTTKRQFR